MWKSSLHQLHQITIYTLLSTPHDWSGTMKQLRGLYAQTFFTFRTTNVDCIKHTKTLHSVTYWNTVMFYWKFKDMQNTQTGGPHTDVWIECVKCYTPYFSTRLCWVVNFMLWLHYTWVSASWCLLERSFDGTQMQPGRSGGDNPYLSPVAVWPITNKSLYWQDHHGWLRHVHCWTHGHLFVWCYTVKVAHPFLTQSRNMNT